MRILNEHFGKLRDHSKLVSEGMSEEHATLLLFGTEPKIRFSELYKGQPEYGVDKIDLTISTLLNLCTFDTLQKILLHHKEMLWFHPDSDKTMNLIHIQKIRMCNSWSFDFEESSARMDQYTYSLKELSVTDKVAFLVTIETFI